MQSKYMNTTAIRYENRTLAGRFRGGKLAPVMAQAFKSSESGILNQRVTFKLDPIAGEMLTPITAEVVAVYVPVQAIDALKDPTQSYPGNTEVVRQKLLSGNPLFDLETEGEISQRLGVVPRSISGVKQVNEAARLAHNCAVNYLRQRKYVNAGQLDKDNTAMTPALIGRTVLDRLNAVLDPEDRVNGAVDLDLSNIVVPISGIGWKGTASPSAQGGNNIKYSDGTQEALSGTNKAVNADAGGNDSVYLVEDPNNAGYPGVMADFAGITAGSISLTDFYTAEKMDALTREMRKMVDQNPEFGEEIVARFAHGLSVDVGKQPFTVYKKSVTFGLNYRQAMDGPSLDESQSDFSAAIDFTVPIPPTELGGIVITFATVKPDEALISQPHPILSDTWGADNHVVDEMAVDPVPVTIRDLYGDCDQGDEGTIACYIGNNHLKKNYVNYGFARNLDTNDVANKTAIWQLAVPMSVTPESVIYPENLNHYPFVDQTAEVVTYTVSNQTTVNTPTIFGPTPVEELAAIETEDVFEDATP